MLASLANETKALNIEAANNIIQYFLVQQNANINGYQMCTRSKLLNIMAVNFSGFTVHST